MKLHVEPCPPRLGWVVFDGGSRPLGHTMQISSIFLSLLLQRKTQIYAAEAIVPLMAALLHPQVFYGRDVVWFCDNEAAVSSLIRGTGKAEDVGHLAAAAQIRWLEIGTKAWYEWIDTDSNPADGLSRAGMEDLWTQSQGWSLQEHGEDAMHMVGQYLRSLEGIMQ